MLGAPGRLSSIRGRVGAHLPWHKTCLCCPQVAKKIIFAGLIYFQCSSNANRVNHFERLHCRRGKCIHHKTWTRLYYLNYIFPLLNCSKDHKIRICNSVSLTEEGHFHLWKKSYSIHQLPFIFWPDCKWFVSHVFHAIVYLAQGFYCGFPYWLFQPQRHFSSIHCPS